MKKLLIGLVALSSFSAFALTQFELEISENHQALKGSKNYESIHDNDDGTVSIVKPKFSDPSGTGASMPLSNDSEVNGVCKLYGLGAFVANSRTDYNAGNSGRNVVISSVGRFSGFTWTKDDYAIDSISCESGIEAPVSNNYVNLSVNDDGSKTIRNPLFFINGKSHILSNDSNLDGVCSLYGLGAYVENSRIDYNGGTSGRNVVISPSGRFAGFTWTKEDYAIESIICESGSRSSASENFQNLSVNDDGSRTIRHPRFMVDRKNHVLSNDSNLDGICKLFGLGNYIDNSRIDYNPGTSGRNVVISSNGSFSSFTWSKDDYAIESLMCE